MRGQYAHVKKFSLFLFTAWKVSVFWPMNEREENSLLMWVWGTKQHFSCVWKGNSHIIGNKSHKTTNFHNIFCRGQPFASHLKSVLNRSFLNSKLVNISSLIPFFSLLSFRLLCDKKLLCDKSSIFLSSLTYHKRWYRDNTKFMLWCASGKMRT